MVARARAGLRAGVAALAVLWVLAGCGEEPPREAVRVGGETMGTTWSVQVVDPPATIVREDLKPHLRGLLDEIDGQMSTWDPESALSRFNRAPPGEWFAVPAALAEVVAVALQLAEETDGALDVTVGSLVDLWGFGAGGEPRTTLPEDDAVAEALARAGYEALAVRHEPPALKKSRSLEVDLSAIAKGYAVDALADALLALGARDFLVEIGGEVRVKGHNVRGEPWRIGVEVPDPQRRGLVQEALAMEEAAVATSGDYRNFFELDGRRYSHTIDPDTGWPVAHDVASVTVVHPSAMWADGLATALTVMGAEDGLALARERELPVLFILHEGEKGEKGEGFAERSSAPFDRYRVGE